MSCCDPERVAPRARTGPSRVAVSAALLLAACGFDPVYGPGGSAEGLRGSLAVETPDTRDGFDFVGRLDNRLGRAGPGAPFGLAYTIEVDQEGVGVTPGQETTRYNLIGAVTYTVTDLATDRVAYTGEADAFTGYSATGSITGTLAASANARKRLMISLADQVVAELIATYPNWK